MPKKKATQKQKQKQSQKTVVNVKVGNTIKKSKPRRSGSAPASRAPSSLSVVLQGSTLSVPNAPTQQYNEMIQATEALRRQMALSGQLIPQRQTNDLLNRVQATNPFENIQQVVRVGDLVRDEGLQQQQVDAETTIDANTSENYSAKVAVDPDWLSNVAMSKIGQNLSTATKKIAADVGDAETRDDITAFSSAMTRDVSELESVATKRRGPRMARKARVVVEEGDPFEITLPSQRKIAAARAAREIASPGVFTPTSKTRGRPKKTPEDF
jgi:hypothetical protein